MAAASVAAEKRALAAREGEPIDPSIAAEPYKERPKLRPLTDEEYPQDLREWAERGPYSAATIRLHGHATDDDWPIPEVRLAAVARIRKARSIGGDTMDENAIDAVCKLCSASRLDLMEEEIVEVEATSVSPQIETTEAAATEDDPREWAWSEPVYEEPVEEHEVQSESLSQPADEASEGRPVTYCESAATIILADVPGAYERLAEPMRAWRATSETYDAVRVFIASRGPDGRMAVHSSPYVIEPEYTTALDRLDVVKQMIVGTKAEAEQVLAELDDWAAEDAAA